MKTWQKWAIGLTITTIFLMGTNKSFGKITTNHKLRNCDPFGCGEFGASRGSRTHNGTDIAVTVGQEIFSPINGEITRYPFPYASDLSFTGIEIKNAQYTVKMFYVTNQLPIGTKVKVGQTIAKAQNIAGKYGSSMQNHVHIEVIDRKTGKYINPETLW